MCVVTVLLAARPFSPALFVSISLPHLSAAVPCTHATLVMSQKHKVCAHVLSFIPSFLLVSDAFVMSVLTVVGVDAQLLFFLPHSKMGYE